MRGRAAATVALALALPSAAHAAAPVMKLSDVRPGMVCQGRSVVRGTTISSFRVDVIDVITGDPTEGPRILVRVSGPPVDSSGVASGFSGSPIYCRDGSGVRRNAGALSETIGEYGNRVALATPIEEMLAVPVSPPAHSHRDPRLLRSARPAEALTVAGLPAGLRRAALRAARHAKVRLIAVPGRPLGTAFPPQQLVPGASVSVGSSDGDVSVGAIGTVTYRDGPRLWAFGHPLDALGPRSLFLQDAYVFTVISNPNVSEEESSFKLAVPGHTLGSLTDDAFGAVAGTVGPQPRAIPLRVTARDLDGNRRFASRSRVADENAVPSLGVDLTTVGQLAVGQAASAILRSDPPRIFANMCVRIRVGPKKRRVGFCGSYFDGRTPLEDLATATDVVGAYEFGRLDIRDVAVRLRLRDHVRESLLVRARGPRRRVRRGSRIRVGLVLRRVRGGPERLSVPVRLPRGLRPGRHTIVIRGTVARGFDEGIEDVLGEALRKRRRAGREHERANAAAGEPRSVGELQADVRSLGSNPGVSVSYDRGKARRHVYRSSRRLIRGKVRVRIRVAGRRRR